MIKRRKKLRGTRHKSKLGKRLTNTVRTKYFEQSLLSQYLKRGNTLQLDKTGKGFWSGSILDANSSSTSKELEVKFQSKLKDIASRITIAEQETGRLNRQVDFAIKRSEIRRPISILGRGNIVTKKIKDTVNEHKLKHKCDIAYILLDKFRQLDKANVSISQFELKDLNVPFSWELGNWCQKLNVRPAEAVRYIVEGMTSTQARKLLHWTERTQSVEGFADPETILIIELVDAYNKRLAQQPDLLLKTFYEDTYKVWFNKCMGSNKYPSYNSFSEWFKWSRRRAVAIRKLHLSLKKYSNEKKPGVA